MEKKVSVSNNDYFFFMSEFKYQGEKMSSLTELTFAGFENYTNETSRCLNLLRGLETIQYHLLIKNKVLVC